MSLSLNQQLYIFFLMLAYGACASAIFDIFRSIYRTFKPSALTVGIGDIFFWLIISISTFYAFFIINNGQIRFFEFIAMILGSIFYFLLLSKIVIFIFSHILTFFKKIFLVIFKIILTILIFLYKMIHRIVLFFFMPVYKLIKKIKQLFIWLFKKCKMGFDSRVRSRRKRKDLKRKKNDLKRRAKNEKKGKRRRRRQKS